jgi:hypothetical protein
MPHARRSHLLALVAGLVSADAASIACADHHAPIAQVGGYDASAGIVPDAQCWSASGLHFAPAPSVDHGALFLGPTSSHAVVGFVRDLEPFSFSDGAAVEATVLIFSSPFVEDDTLGWTGFSFGLHDELGRFARLGLADDRIVLETTLDGTDGQAPGTDGQGTDGQAYFMSTTDGYHTYRIDFADSIVTVSVDGVAVLFGSVGGSTTTNVAAFGDQSIVGASTSATASVVVEAAAPFLPSDLDRNGLVGGGDLAIMIGAWGTSDCSADLTFDGVVDAMDLAVLFGAWS